MKDKFEHSSIFIPFFNEIKTQFENPIKIFWSDNAKQYFLLSFLYILVGYFTSNHLSPNTTWHSRE